MANYTLTVGTVVVPSQSLLALGSYVNQWSTFVRSWDAYSPTVKTVTIMSTLIPVPPTTGQIWPRSGAIGQQGARGTSWFTGHGVPHPPISGSQPGDLYLDLDTGNVYSL